MKMLRKTISILGIFGLMILFLGSSGKKNQIIINGIVLSEAQVNEIKKTYNIKPRPGNYWYDAKSGLYGVVGYPAYSFMFAGHEFGSLTERPRTAGQELL